MMFDFLQEKKCDSGLQMCLVCGCVNAMKVTNESVMAGRCTWRLFANKLSDILPFTYNEAHSS